MIIREENINILNAPQGYTIAVDFSADMNYESGLSKVLNETFNIEERLPDSLIIIDGNEDDPLDCGQIYEVGNLYMLIVKENSFDLPDHSYLMESLEELRKQCEFDHIKRLAIPKICSEENEFEWEDVKQLIDIVFRETDVEILVCCE